MIRQVRRDGLIDLTFSLDHAAPVAVVGEFNGWDPCAHPLVKRSNGRRSVRVTVPPGRYAFRYANGHGWFDDAGADHLEDNGYGQTHGVLVVE